MAFMNRSGLAIFAVAQFYKIAPEEILVVLDDLALPLGRIRLRPDGGTGGHNGLESILVQFGTEEIPRLRIGIGGGARAAEAVKCAIDNGLVSAMNKFNKSEES